MGEGQRSFEHQQADLTHSNRLNESAASLTHYQSDDDSPHSSAADHTIHELTCDSPDRNN